MTGPRTPNLGELRLVTGAGTRDDDRATFLHVVGSLSGAIRLAPVISALGSQTSVKQVVADVSDPKDGRRLESVLADLGLAPPDHELGVADSTGSEQTAQTLVSFERLLDDLLPELVVLCGSGSTTVACALATTKRGIALAHLDAGLRSTGRERRDINRQLTDHMADTLLAPTIEAGAALAAEGIPDTRIHVTGSTAVAVLRRTIRAANALARWRAFGVEQGEYVLVALTSRDTLDDAERLSAITGAVADLATSTPVLLSLPPRVLGEPSSRRVLDALEASGVQLVPALGYRDFLSLHSGAGALVTDSGALQDEACALGVSCHTLGSSTDRSITLTHGSNVMLGDDPRSLATVRPTSWSPTPSAIPFWDGRAGERAADVLVSHYVLRNDAEALS